MNTIYFPCFPPLALLAVLVSCAPSDTGYCDPRTGGIIAHLQCNHNQGKGYARFHQKDTGYAIATEEQRRLALSQQDKELNDVMAQRHVERDYLWQKLRALDNSIRSAEETIHNLETLARSAENMSYEAQNLHQEVYGSLARLYHQIDQIERSAREGEAAVRRWNPCAAQKMNRVAETSRSIRKRIFDTLNDIIVPDIVDVAIWFAPVRRTYKMAYKIIDVWKAVYDNWIVECI